MSCLHFSGSPTFPPSSILHPIPCVTLDHLSLFQARTSLLLTGLPLSCLCKLAYLLVALGVGLELGRELLASSSSFPLSPLSVAPSSWTGVEVKGVVR